MFSWLFEDENLCAIRATRVTNMERDIRSIISTNL
jgi:histone H3/H4